MKRVLLFMLILMLALVACRMEPGIDGLADSQGTGYGSLYITTNHSSSRTIEPDPIDRRCTSYEIFLKGLSFDFEESYTTTSKNLMLENIKAGDYEVYVEGINESDVHIVTSDKKTITIKNKTTTEVEFSLNRYTSGTGQFSLSVMVPKNETQIVGMIWALGRLFDDNYEPIYGLVDTYEISSDGKYRCYNVERLLPTGSFDLEFVMCDGNDEQVGFLHVDSVHIYRDSVSSLAYEWDNQFFPAVASPYFDLAEGTYSEGQIVRIISNDQRAELYYTLDGTDPTPESSLYVNPIVLTENTELKAIAYVEGLRQSEPFVRDYKIKVATPEFSIRDQSVVDYDNLSISTSTNGARIIYTLDGSDPSLTNGNTYDGPILLSQSLTVKAIAVKDNLESSDVISADYYDRNSPSPEYFFSITSKGAVSVDRSYINSLPNVLIIPEEINGIEVTSVANNGFRMCSSLSILVLPNTVTSIGDNAFTGCSGITSIDVSEYVTQISTTAFSGWSDSQKINDYSGLIRSGTLINCSARIYATIKMGTTEVGGYTGMSNLYGINLPNSVTTIADNAFSGCVNLKEFSLPNYVTTIGELAFNDCTSLSSITLPSILKSVNYDSFRNWTSEQIIIDNSGLLALQRMADSSAKIYTTVPASINNVPVDSIPAYISRGRDDVYGLVIPPTVKTIESYALEGTSIEEITIPATVESIGLEVFKGWSDSQKVHYVYGGATVSTSETATSFSGSNASYDVSFVDGVTSIVDHAFDGMMGLAEISIPESVIRIGACAFRNTSIRTISIGDNVVSLGDYCLYNCDKLDTVSLGSGLWSVGEGAFADCDKLVNVALPDNVVFIEDGVFADCALLETVDLGNGITEIPQLTFYNSPRLSQIISPGCKGSFVVTVNLPVEQLIAKTIHINVDPTYASIPGYSTVIDRIDQQFDDGYRKFTYCFTQLPGIEYTATITLKDVDDNTVGSYTSASVPVPGGDSGTVVKTFSESELETRTLSLPIFNLSSGSYLDGTSLVISSEDATDIIYTLDGSTPSELNGNHYEGPITLDKTETVKAIGIKEGYHYSAVATSSYTIQVQAPVFSVVPGLYHATQTVSLNSGTAGAYIYYSLDGTTPDENSIHYTDPFDIGSTSTLRAVAFKSGLIQSTVSEGLYTISLPEHDIVDPVYYSLAITGAGEEISGSAVLTAEFSPSVLGSSYRWFLDGEEVSNAQSFEITEGLIDDGYHIIEVVSIYDNNPYSYEFVFRYQR